LVCPVPPGSKDVLIDFFAQQTDFSKVLTSWRPTKFEDAATKQDPQEAS
jgi:hypothetical protein